jgi:hypothetical protein
LVESDLKDSVLEITPAENLLMINFLRYNNFSKTFQEEMSLTLLVLGERKSRNFVLGANNGAPYLTGEYSTPAPTWRLSNNRVNFVVYAIIF